MTRGATDSLSESKERTPVAEHWHWHKAGQRVTRHKQTCPRTQDISVALTQLKRPELRSGGH